MNTDNGKTIAIIAHITWIGWIIALIMNSFNKTSLGEFYLNQVLGLYLTGLVGSLVGNFIPFLDLIISLALVVFGIMSLINAINEEEEPLPLVGEFYQNFFR